MPSSPKLPTPPGFPAGLSQPALRALQGAGISRLEQLTRIAEGELATLHGIGPRALEALRQTLAASGKSFAR